MNWGKSLVVVFVVFVGAMGYFLYRAVNTKSDLVTKEYYKDELNYQQQIDAKANAAALSEMEIVQNTDDLIVKLPKEQKGMKAQGQLWFYCETDASKDKKISLSIADTTGTQIVDKKLLNKGFYHLKIDWTVGSQSFYVEKKMDIN